MKNILLALSLIACVNAHAETAYSIYQYPHLYKVEEIKSVYDGDTVKVVLDRGFGDFKHISVRLYGIDTPEKRGQQAPAGKLVQQVVEGFLKDAERNHSLYVVAITKDKYAGRVVGDIFWKDKQGVEHSLADYLTKHMLGKRYLGSTKEEWTEEQLAGIRERCRGLLREPSR